MKIAENAVVTINYTLKDIDGNTLDTTEGKGPLSYIHGVGYLIPGVEQKLDGKKSGENLSFVVEPEEGYGVRDETLIQNIPVDQFEDPNELEIGMEFEAQTEYGLIIVTIIGLEDDQVIVDGNHPLSGKTLNFEIEVLSVREASGEELDDGEIKEPTIPIQ